MAQVIPWYGKFAVATIQGQAALIHRSDISYDEAVQLADKLNEAKK